MRTLYCDVDVDRAGTLRDPSQVHTLLDRLRGVSDVVLFAPGWSDDRAEAVALGDAFAARIDQITDAGVIPGLTGRRLAVVRVLWPARKVVAHRGDTAVSTEQYDELLRLLDALAADAPAGSGEVARAKVLVRDLALPDARDEFIAVVRGLLDPGAADEDDGSRLFFTASSERLFAAFGADDADASASHLVTQPPSDQLEAALRIVGYASYYQLKGVADRVAQAVTGLLRLIRDAHPLARLHLVGHSLGGRVVTAAAATMPPQVVSTLLLLLPALGQDAFATATGGAPTGRFSRLLRRGQMSGPLLIVHSASDRDGCSYPVMGAMMAVRNQGSAHGDAAATAGTMGRHGTRHTPEAIAVPLQPTGAPYYFLAGPLINLQADPFVSRPADVAGPEVVSAFLHGLMTPARPFEITLRSGWTDLAPAAPELPPVPQFPQSGGAATAPAAAPMEHHVVRVFYGTSRARDDDAEAVAYSSERGKELSVGFAHVSIPFTHRRGQIERPAIWRLELTEDPDRHVAVLSVLDVPIADFLARMRDDFSRSGTDATFVFIHGYNVTFEEAARRTAQLGHDLGIAVPAMFSWPSGGLVRDYIADATVAEWSVPILVSFLRMLRAQSGARHVHLIAHSMGNRVLAGALAALRGEASPGPLFQQIVLTAPDIDAAVFEQQIASQIRPCGARMTLYASSADKALKVAHRLHHARRAGDAGDDVLVVNGIDTIDATKVSTGLGHSSFGDVRSVLEDLSLLLRLGLPPDQRNLVAVRRGAAPYWEFPS